MPPHRPTCNDRGVPVNAHQVCLLTAMISHRAPNLLSGIPGGPPCLQAASCLALVETVRALVSLFLPWIMLMICLDEPVPSYLQSGLAFGSRPSTPPRRSYDNDSWNSSDLRGQTWGELVVAPFSSDDANLSPGKRRVGDLPRSTSPFHSLQETRHRQATAAQAAALGHPSESNAVEEASRALNDSTLADRSRGRSVDMDELTARNGNLDSFHQRQVSRGQQPFDMGDNSGRGIRANILGALEDDFPPARNHPISRTRVHTMDPSFSLEPLQRANSTPPYSGPVPISSRELPRSGLNPYPQSRTPQLQSSGHFTTSSRDDPLLTSLRDLNIGSRNDEMGGGRKVSSNSFVGNLGSAYPSGIHISLSC